MDVTIVMIQRNLLRIHEEMIETEGRQLSFCKLSEPRHGGGNGADANKRGNPDRIFDNLLHETITQMSNTMNSYRKTNSVIYAPFGYSRSCEKYT